jgi:peroxiredoxin
MLNVRCTMYDVRCKKKNNLNNHNNKTYMKKLSLILLVAVVAACGREKIRISGTIAGAEKKTLYFDEVNVYDNTVLDSAVLKKSGRFSFSRKADEPGFYQLKIGNDVIVLFPEPGEHITVSAAMKNVDSSLVVEGSEGTMELAKLIKRLHATTYSLDSINTLFKSETSDSAKLALNATYNDILEKHRKYSKGYLLTHSHSLTSVYVLYQQYFPNSYVFYKTSDLQFFKIITDSLSKYHPRSKHVRSLKAFTQNRIDQYNSKLMLKDVKDIALPALRLPDMKGDTVNIKDFKGKYVLLCFWVPGDNNCTTQNLELKKVYASFRKKGFEIVQVALDNNPDRWKMAVRYDELPWVSLIDARFPNSIVAGNYNVTQVPSNYLIDKDNVSIKGKDLSAALLRDKLSDLIK